MSIIGIDPQIAGVMEDGSPEGAVRSVASNGHGVWVGIRNSRYIIENSGSTASYVSAFLNDNPDGTGQGINISVPNTSGSGVRIWVPFAGRMFGVRWRRQGSTTPVFTVVVDGVPVQVSGRPDRLVDEGLTVSGLVEQGIAITHDNLDPAIPHYAEIIVTADVGGSARPIVLFGWVLDALAGYQSPPRSHYLIGPTACPTSMTAIPSNAGGADSATLGFARLTYYNSSGGALDVTVEYNTVTFWKKSIAAGNTEVFDAGGLLAYNTLFRHMASGSGITFTVIGGY